MSFSQTYYRLMAEKGYLVGKSGGARLNPYYPGMNEFEAWDGGYYLGRQEYIRTLPPSQSMEATVDSEFV